MYEKPATSVGGSPTYHAASKSDHPPAQAKVDVITREDVSGVGGNWLTKSVTVGKSISTEKKQPQQPVAQARIDEGNEGDDLDSEATAAVVSARVSVSKSSKEKEEEKVGDAKEQRIFISS